MMRSKERLGLTVLRVRSSDECRKIVHVPLAKRLQRYQVCRYPALLALDARASSRMKPGTACLTALFCSL
jgi:hypothetical protein